MLTLRVLLALLLMSLPASANFGLGGHGAPGSGPAPQTIASVPLSGTTFPPGASSGTVVGTIGTPVMSPASPAFSGSCCTLNSGDFASFQIVGSSLETNGVLCGSPPCTYHFNIRATQGGISNSPFDQAVTITSSSLVFSQTVKNIGASTTPTIAGTTMVPTQFGVPIPPGIVPTGNIIVPQVGGVTLTNAQIDSQQCSYWYTGSTPTSLRWCPFSGFVPQMTAGASTQVTFAIASGSFPTTSSVTPATIAAASDFKVVASKANSSFTRQGPEGPSVQYGVNPGFYITAGAISGGYVRNQPTPAGAPQGLLGSVCTTSNCITPANYQQSVSTTTLSGTTALVFSVAPFPSLVAQGTKPVTVIDVTNPSSIPDNTTVAGGGTTITMSAPAAANITSSDVLQFGYAIEGGTSLGAYTVNINGSGIATGVNIVKPGAGFSAFGSGAMTADIDTILNAYGSTQPPSCAARPGAATFLGAGGPGTLATTSTTGVISIGQMVDDGTNLVVITGGSGTSWTTNGTLAPGPIMMAATPALCIATSGPTMYELRGFGAYRDNVSGAKDAQERFRFTIQAWTGPTGLYAIRPTITSDNSIFQNQTGFADYTYDADFLNGSTEIVGCAQGGSNNKWCAIQQQVNGSWASLDPCESCATGASGRPVWLPPTGGYSTANSQALAQIVIAPASADLAFIHASHAAPPLDNSIVPSQKVVTSTSAPFGSPFYANLYAPYEHGGTDATVAFGSGGANHDGLGPMGTLWGYWYLSVANGASDGGVSFLANMRVAAESTAGMMDGPRYDDTNLPINMYESGSGYTPPAAFTDAQLWDIVISDYGRRLSYPNHFMWQGLADPAVGNALNSNSYTQVQNNDGYGDTSHWPELERAIYLLEGEGYILQNWIDEAEGVAMGPINTQANTRSMSFGGVRYDAQYMSSAIERQNAWAMNVLGPLSYLGPANEPAIQYFRHNVDNNYAMNLALYSFIGTGNFWATANGASQWTFTKYYDNTTNGWPVETEVFKVTVPNFAGVAGTEFMDYYWAMNTLDVGGMLDNANSANAMGFVSNFIDNFAIHNPAVNCVYNAASYVEKWGVSPEPDPIHPTGSPKQQPQPGWDATMVSAPQEGRGPIMGDNTIHVESGSTVVSATIEALTGNTGAWSFNPTATSAVSVGGTSIPLSGVIGAQTGTISTGSVIKDLTNPTALTWPTYTTGAPTGLTIPISSPVTGPGISSGDVIAVSAAWPWVYPAVCSIPTSFAPVCTYPAGTARLATGTRMSIANVNWHDQTSPNDADQQFSATEAHTIPASPAFTVVSTNAMLVSFSVNYASGGAPLTKVGSSPSTGQYTLNVPAHTYTFSAGDAGVNITINYAYSIPVWPPPSTPQVTDPPEEWLYLCMDASGAAFGQLSTTPCGSPTYVTWNVTADFATSTVANASCPASAAGDWRYPNIQGEEMAEMYAASRWRKALNGVLGTSTDASTAIPKLIPYVTPLNSTYSSGQAQWGADDNF